jgi:A/G-specific adenine glycosylase
MEFGAGVCTARAPRCDGCPIAHGCPSRGRAGTVAVPRQAPFAGSRRAQRGRLLRALSAAPGHRLPEALARAAVDGATVEATGWDTLLGSLEGDGLIHRSAGQVVLGPTPDAGATKGSRGPTIGP